MPLGLSFNQYGLYPYVSFWSPSFSRGLVISQLMGLMTCCVPIRISSLGKSLTISMKQRADRLLLRIYFAPYGRTNNVVMAMLFINMRRYHIGIFSLQNLVCQLYSNVMCFFITDLTRIKRLYQMVCLIWTVFPAMVEGVFEVNGGRFRCTGKGRNEKSVCCFFRVTDIIYRFINGCVDSMDFCCKMWLKTCTSFPHSWKSPALFHPEAAIQSYISVFPSASSFIFSQTQKRLRIGGTSA